MSAEFETLLAGQRAKLHRYCARMAGSVIDGEDIVQTAFAKAIAAFAQAPPRENAEAWLFRIAHNAALDFLRHRARRRATAAPEEIEMIADPIVVADDRMAAAAALHTLMRLPVAQRGAIVLADVLGHSAQEVAAITATTIPAVKAALHRARARLRDFATEPADVAPPALAPADRARLASYVERFNARDFDAVRAMLADEVRLELVNRVRLDGRQAVGTYLHRYGEVTDWHFAAGLVEGRAAILVQDPDDPASRPKYFILLEWQDGAMTAIRDFLFARYAIEGAALHLFT